MVPVVKVMVMVMVTVVVTVGIPAQRHFSSFTPARTLLTITGMLCPPPRRLVQDMGCGCGVLAIGCTIMGAGTTIGFDLDPDALAIAAANCEELEVPVDLVRATTRKTTPFPKSQFWLNVPLAQRAPGSAHPMVH